MNPYVKALSLRPRDHPQFSTFRIDAFTDAVFAIAATILVLELHPPHFEQGHLVGALVGLWPHYVAYALGFVQIVGGWMVLKRITASVTGFDHYSTLLMLFAEVSFVLIPFTVSVLAESFDNRNDLAAAVRLLSLVTLVSMMFFSALCAYLTVQDKWRPENDPVILRLEMIVCFTVWVWPALALALSYVSPAWALGVLVFYTMSTLWPIDGLNTDGYESTPEGRLAD